MGHRGKRGEGRRTNLGRWRIESDRTRMFCFERNELTLEFVIFGITDFGRVVSEIVLVVLIERVAKVCCAGDLVFGRFRARSHVDNITCGLHHPTNDRSRDERIPKTR